MLWEVDIYPAVGQPDLEAERIRGEIADLGLAIETRVQSARGYLIQGSLQLHQVQRLANQLLADRVVERTVVSPVGDAKLSEPPGEASTLVHVLPKPGVMDPVALSAKAAMSDYGADVQEVRTLRKFWFDALAKEQLNLICTRILANDSIEQTIAGPLQLSELQVGAPYQFRLQTVPLRDLDDERLLELSRTGQLYLTLVEMQTIRDEFRNLDRDPTDAELETIAQTWSEHCSHKTLAGKIAYRDEHGARRFENMLKETIFAATNEIRQKLGDDDWCVSVFKDNAGIVRFDEKHNVVFKVETHNHPSAIEPYGGANTGIGGVIRDPMGTGLGAKPICNTDVFCFAPPNTPMSELPPGTLHPRRVMKGVVSGVRDYGNRMGIPTVNGAIYFDDRYLGNPLVYCGNVGILPREKSDKQPQPGDYIVGVGGRTGRDGIHGATFSSAELTSESETISGGAVQIGNAITEKMVLDVLIAARDRGLFNAVTDCGAGGFSSAVGEMGEEIGAVVWLDKAPLKYDGLSYTEIWISEAQERMVFAVPPGHWDEFQQLCASEGVEATVLGEFEPTGRLKLKYGGHEVADLSMEFLHDGRPPVVRDAVYRPQPGVSCELPVEEDYTADLKSILGCLNVCSKEWVIRQYDHEVQGGSVIKPLVGVDQDGPSDASVVRPVLSSWRGLAISCGMNPHFGQFDTYHMAASAIDEAIRNCVAVGADPDRIAILDNFCWGYTDRPETLGSLVRAALACHDVAVALRTPFISGKDSLNNEFSYDDKSGHRQTISIPPSLLISAMGQIEDVRRCVTMDFKQTGNEIFQIGLTKDEMAGSHFAVTRRLSGGHVPRVDAGLARQTFLAIHRAIGAGLVQACHDMSEGGLAVAVAEMAFAGGFRAELDLQGLRETLTDKSARDVILLFSESNSRFLCEVRPNHVEAFTRTMGDVPFFSVGQVVSQPRLVVRGSSSSSSSSSSVVNADLRDLKEAWQAPLRW